MDRVFGVPYQVVKFYYCKYGWEDANKKRNISAGYGTKIHKFLNDYYFNNKINIPDTSIAKRTKCIDEYFESNKITPVHGEKTIYNHKLQIAGTCDFIGINNHFKDRKIIILDWKSGSSNPDKEIMQIGTYGYSIIDMPEFKELNIKPNELTGVIVYVHREDKKPQFVEYSATQMKQGFQAFKNVLNLLKFKTKYGRK
jgi:hypothetical protein